MDSGQRQPRNQRLVAMEPSFWSWEKHLIHRRPPAGRDPSQWSPAFGAGKSNTRLATMIYLIKVAMEPSFWSWEKPTPSPVPSAGILVAMEPSFWSWEKSSVWIDDFDEAVSSQWSPAFGAGKRRANSSAHAPTKHCRNGAQLLELGKAELAALVGTVGLGRNGAQLLELGKVLRLVDGTDDVLESQWSPAFGAGKRIRE